MSEIEELISREFPVNRNLIHLNHAAVGPWPFRTSEEVRKFAKENCESGSKYFNRWLETEASLRQKCADLIVADSADDISLLKNTSEGLSMVAHGFPWKPGDNVVISDQEFPSNRIVWQSLQEKGVEVREVPLPCPGPVEENLIAATDSRTRMISISSVQYASGLRVDLETLGGLCHERGIAFCVDAIQGLGVFPHNVKLANIDFLVADGHKWLLSPEGIAIFYCAPQWRKRLSLHEYGWRMTEKPLEFNNREWRPASTGRRFECGSQNMTGIIALHASLSLFFEIGVEDIWKRVAHRTELLFDLVLNQENLELLTCASEGRYAGITVFRHQTLTDQQLYERFNQGNVLCAMRGGGIRLSPHFHTPIEHLEQAIDIAVN